MGVRGFRPRPPMPVIWATGRPPASPQSRPATADTPKGGTPRAAGSAALQALKNW
ncbi:hypothetical protein GCM10018783_57680 [Streptomyces griseosporeus]|nr:hypothetical protein GCM10018783_57680 [Streptomyces griseosporeus]